MTSIPKKVVDRLRSGLRKYHEIIRAQRDRDVSEADTVTLVKDLLWEVFGFDKYTDVTGEHAIRGTRCDLAIKIDDKLRMLLEVKAIGVDLKDQHVRQAIDYAANQGVEWVVLTNGIRWVLYHILFKQPIDKEEIADVDLLNVEARRDEDLCKLFLFSKEGVLKEALEEYRDLKDATSRFMLAAILTESDAVMNSIRKEVRKVSEILVDPGVIQKALRDEVIKRDCLEGDQAAAATKRFVRVERAANSDRRKSSDATVECNDKTGAQGSSPVGKDAPPKPGA